MSHNLWVTILNQLLILILNNARSQIRDCKIGSWMVVRVIVGLGSAAGEAGRRENDSAGEREIEISQRETEKLRPPPKPKSKSQHSIFFKRHDWEKFKEMVKKKILGLMMSVQGKTISTAGNQQSDEWSIFITWWMD